MVIDGRTSASAYCNPKEVAASYPTDCGMNQFPCLVYAMRNSFTSVGLIVQVSVNCAL
jgi:hypothetical protein